MVDTERPITFEELSQHNKEDDLWLLIDGKAHRQHPGGEEVLLTEAGKDATEPFEDVGHSEDAREDLRKLQIGILSDPVGISRVFVVLIIGKCAKDRPYCGCQRAVFWWTVRISRTDQDLS
ncbi:hypothetical protein MPSI1_002485 [Malassezia psittaci]|uniref:Cytochrome b5 heme-binding domain-containing protein n=1 Tax=Malassezia psittaci TaxID=1821823 RepID=A0AAF0FAD9_9BASI|nr:hypothetical protein MPSI1_002485 [Malassezia psittaci]